MPDSIHAGVLVKVSVFKEPIFKGETFLLSLPPLFIVKVDVSALKENTIEGLCWVKDNHCIYLFILLINHLRLLVSLEPHHVLGVEPPALLLQGLGRQVLGLGPLHVVEDEEECLGGQPLEEVDGVAARRRGLGVVGWGLAWVPGKVGSQSLRITGVRQVLAGGLQHAATRNIEQSNVNILKCHQDNVTLNIHVRRINVYSMSVLC